MAKAPSKKSTSKKIRVVGQQTYINAQTGEAEQFQVMSIEDRDANFDKQADLFEEQAPAAHKEAA